MIIIIIKKLLLWKKKFFPDIKKTFFVEAYKMVNLATHKLKLIVEKRGIKSYKNMSREKLLSTLNKLESIFKNISQNGLERIAKM